MADDRAANSVNLDEANRVSDGEVNDGASIQMDGEDTAGDGDVGADDDEVGGLANDENEVVSEDEDEDTGSSDSEDDDDEDKDEGEGDEDEGEDDSEDDSDEGEEDNGSEDEVGIEAEYERALDEGRSGRSAGVYNSDGVGIVDEENRMLVEDDVGGVGDPSFGARRQSAMSVDEGSQVHGSSDVALDRDLRSQVCPPSIVVLIRRTDNVCVSSENTFAPIPCGTICRTRLRGSNLQRTCARPPALTAHDE